MRRCRLGCLLLAVATPAVAQMGADFNRAESVLDCDRVVERYGGEVLAYGCYLNLARRLKDYASVQRHLEARLRVDPGDHAARLNLGRTYADLGDARALERYDEALQGFRRDGNDEGAVYTLLMMAFYAQFFHDFATADAHLSAADEHAAASGDRSLQSRVKERLARLAIERNDYGRAYAMARAAEGLAFPDGDLNSRVGVLGLLGTISKALERPDLALAYFEREAELLGDGTIQWLATIHVDIADLARRVRTPRRYSLSERIALAERAIDTAARSGNQTEETRARIVLGQLLDGETATRQYERAWELAMEVDDRTHGVSALWGLAWEHFHAADRQGALRNLETAERLSRRIGSARHIARTAILRADLAWLLGDVEAATAASFAALDEIERFRDLQADETVRARSFGAFADAYARYADRLLAAGDLESALRVEERMRSRVLLDHLDEIRVAEEIAKDHPLAQRRARVLEELASVQRTLLDARPEREERDRLLRELDRLEGEEAALRASIAEENPGFAALRRPTFPRLATVRQSLGEEEALLVFLFGREPSYETRSWRGGSRALVVTSSGTRVVEIEEDENLPARIAAFNELLRLRSGVEAVASASLYADLLGDAVSALPSTVRRLIVVPDGPTFQLPWSALRAIEREDPLASRFDVRIAPSVTLWMRWRGAEPGEKKFPALVLADPERSFDDAVSETRSSGALGAPPTLGPLPQARREGRAIARNLGRASRLLVGRDASEAALKRLPVGDYRILHFAAHAVVDRSFPQRSAVVLAPGDDLEDGLLQPREIAALDLSGGIVILSACSSAGGELLAGEGVLGLARAFFQAGAHTVVGGLWPLRDDEAADLIEEVGRRLQRGASVGAAVAATKREWIRDGRPAAAWAGLVVLGDGDVTPVPGGSRALPAWWPLVAVGLAALAVAGIRFAVRRKRA